MLVRVEALLRTLRLPRQVVLRLLAVPPQPVIVLHGLLLPFLALAPIFRSVGGDWPDGGFVGGEGPLVGSLVVVGNSKGN